MREISFAFATPADAASVQRLLAEGQLPAQDILQYLEHFVLALADEEPVAVVGLEILGPAGLLRSLAVSAAYRGRGLAKALCARAFAHARLQGVHELYLLTTTAERFFAKLGFNKVERARVPDAVRSTEEFRNLCPSTAVCMAKNLKGEVEYYPREVLVLRPDVPGARLWGVALGSTLLTYFEVEPHSRFELHSHESEQITLVLAGELFFETVDGVVRVQEEEVIAIPSRVPHAVFTKDRPARAVDAWSPVEQRYAAVSE
jgi:amino-acid N-acetyltransferase